MNIRALHDSLSTKLGLLRHKINHENKTNDFSLNLLLETVSARILNVIQNYNYVNANLIEKNFPGVDLIDRENKLMIQVSTTCTAEKIKHTLIQIKKHSLTNDFEKLSFFFLGDIKNLSSKSKSSINKLIPKGLKFDLDKDLYSTYRIYEDLISNQNSDNTLDIINILDEVLGFIPKSKCSGFESISLSCSADNEGVYPVVDYFLKSGINVYLNSEKIYNKFLNHGLFDYLILINDLTSFKHIKYCVVLIDNYFVDENNGFNDIKCNLLKNAIERDIRIQIVDYQNSTDFRRIRNDYFRNWISCSESNLSKKLKRVLNDFFRPQIPTSMNSLDISEELKKIYKNFTFEELNSDVNTGYRLLKFNFNGFSDMTIYYIILTKDYVLISVKDHIIKNYNIIRNRTTVLVIKDPLQKTTRRLDNIEKALNISNVKYVSEHLFEKTLKLGKQESILYIDDFVEPILRYQDQENEGSTSIINWVTGSNDTSVAIVSGQGGIGKTTLCEKIHDRLINESNNFHVIFITSDQLIKEFMEIDFNNELEYDIYNLYKVSRKKDSIDETVLIDQKSFEVNYELGNILIVFDGIDELISTIPSFTLLGFLKNVSKIEAGIGKGKIIINCRDTYISDIDKSWVDLDIFELLPFNKRLARVYFEQHFEQPKKVKSCLELLADFVNSDSLEDEYIYPPFVVEIVRLFVQKEIEVEEGDATFESSYLTEDSANDLIVFKTCYREIIKKETHGFELSVDKQIEFMIEVAHGFEGKFKEEDFEKILKRIGCSERLADLTLGIKDHPFLTRKDKTYYFRFDFLNTFFKSIFIYSIISNPKPILVDKKVIYLLSEELDYYSQTARYLVQKIKKNFNNYLDNCKDLVNLIKNSKVDSINYKRRAISNVFMLLIQASDKEKVSNLRKIMKHIFGGKIENTIDGLCLINIPKVADLKFDFEGLIFLDTYIENFDGFLISKFDNNTLFDDSCEINKIKNNLGSLNVYSININHFDTNIKGDNSLIKYLTTSQEHISKTKRIILTNSFKFFFKSFYAGNSIKMKCPIRNIRTNFKYLGGSLDIDPMIIQLKEQDILRINNDVFILNSKYKNKISKFVTQGLNFYELNIAITNTKT